MAEWRGKGLTRYGAPTLQSQMHCDFIGDNTCVTVGLVESTDDKGAKMNYKWAMLSCDTEYVTHNDDDDDGDGDNDDNNDDDDADDDLEEKEGEEEDKKLGEK